MLQMRRLVSRGYRGYYIYFTLNYNGLANFRNFRAGGRPEYVPVDSAKRKKPLIPIEGIA